MVWIVNNYNFTAFENWNGAKLNSQPMKIEMAGLSAENGVRER